MNVVVSLAGVVTGNRLVLRFVTCGYLGSKEYSRGWQLLWLIPFSLQLGANGVIALLMARVPGYVATFSIGQLVVFYTARPRLGWVVIGALSLWSRPAPPSVDRPGRGPGRWRTGYDREPSNLPSYWHNAAMSQMVAEIALQLMALYVMGTTVRFAATRGYYAVGSEAYSSVPPPARLMYAGAMWYLVTGASQLFSILPIQLGMLMKRRSGGSGGEPSENQRIYVAFMLIFSFLFTWVSAWLFWAGFLGLAETSYVPPLIFPLFEAVG